MKLIRNNYIYLVFGLFFICTLVTVCNFEFVSANAKSTGEKKLYCSATIEDEFEEKQIHYTYHFFMTI